MTSPLRVLQVLTAYSDEAPAQSAAALAKYLDRNRFDVVALSLRAPRADSPTVDDLERSGLRHATIGMRGFLDLVGVRRLLGFMRHWRPDIVHSHAFRADLWCVLCGRLARVPLIVVTIRNHDRDCFRTEHDFVVGRLATAASRLSTALADAVVAVSEGVADYLVRDQGVPRAKIHVIPNGFDFDKLAQPVGDGIAFRSAMNWGRDDVVVGTLASLKPRKGITYLVEAARTVLAACPQARFFVAGEGPERAALEADIDRFGLRSRFQLLGHRPDAMRLIAASDIYALPSLFEGMPRSVLEAMALSKPVVVTDIGGSREVVRDGESGLVVAPRTASVLAEALCRLIVSPDLRQRYGAEGRRLLTEGFDARRTASAHEPVYQLLATKRRR